MTLTDYTDLVADLQRVVGEKFRQDRDILNVPGVSMACRIDEHYFLALESMLLKNLGMWAAVLPSRVLEALIKTGNMLTCPPDRGHSLDLRTTWEGLGRFARIKACFVQADFFDRALKIYAGQIRPLPLGNLYVHADDRPEVEKFFKGKTPPASWLYQEQPG